MGKTIMDYFTQGKITKALHLPELSPKIRTQKCDKQLNYDNKNYLSPENFMLALLLVLLTFRMLDSCYDYYCYYGILWLQ